MKRINRIFLLFLIVFCFSSFFSCDIESPIGRACTDIFQMVGITVFSAEDEPVILDQIIVTSLETGRVLNLCETIGSGCENGKPIGQPEKGRYTIFHDGLRDEIPGDDTKILVEGSNDEIHFQEEFKIGDNGCHVFKEAGPDTIFVEVE